MGARNEKKKARGDKTGPGESVVAENSHFEGKINGIEGVRILGNFKGEAELHLRFRLKG